MSVNNRTEQLLERIFDAQLNHGERLGGIEGKLHRIENQCSMCTVAIQDVGKKAAIHDSQLERHEKRLSDIFKRIECEENSQVIHITQERARWSTIKIIGAIILGVLTAMSGIFGLNKALNGGETHGRYQVK